MTRIADVKLHSSTDGAIHWITLEGAPANIIGAETCGQLRRTLDGLASNAQARLVVLRGAGEHFSFGASVEEHLPEHVERMLSELHAVARTLAGLPIPTLAAVRGKCLGGGFELALACGMMFLEEGAVLAAPEIRLGVFAPAATAILAGLPRAVAEEILLTGRDVTVEEALRWGIANRACPRGQLDKAVEQFADEHFRPRSAASLRVATAAVREGLAEVLTSRLQHMERHYLGTLMPLADSREGIRAFLDKRAPRWEHR